MNPTKTLLGFSFCMILISYVSGQTGGAPNLSGTWKLMQSTNQARLTDGSEETMTIKHNEPQISVFTRVRSNGQEKTLQQDFFSDGRGETNPTHGSQLLESKTKWKGKRLETSRVDSLSIIRPDGEKMTVKLNVVRRWELSKDGNSLTILTSISGPPNATLKNAAGSGPAKDVYVRTEASETTH